MLIAEAVRKWRNLSRKCELRQKIASGNRPLFHPVVDKYLVVCLPFSNSLQSAIKAFQISYIRTSSYPWKASRQNGKDRSCFKILDGEKKHVLKFRSGKRLNLQLWHLISPEKKASPRKKRAISKIKGKTILYVKTNRCISM